MSATYASDMLARFDANIRTVTRAPTGTALRPSAYRLTLENEPDSGVDGLYFIDLESAGPVMRQYNGQDNVWTGRVNVQLGFHRGGGDMAGTKGGNRRTVRDFGSNDCQLVAESCSDPENYVSATSGIRVVTYAGFRRAFSGKRIEVWEVMFDVEWRSELVTATVAAESLPETVYEDGFASAMLTNFERQLRRVTRVTTGLQLTRSGYRFTPEAEPDSAKDGLFFLDVQQASPKARYFGTGQSIWEGTVAVQVAFHRGGGDMGRTKGGDRRNVLDAASADCMGVVDVCENPDNYAPDDSGIRKVSFAGFRRALSQPRADIWEVVFNVEWMSDATLAASTGSDDDVMLLDAPDAYYVTGTTPEVVLQFTADLTRFSASTLTLTVSAETCQTGAATGTYNVYMGGTDMTVDGTLMATITSTRSSYTGTVDSAISSSFATPSTMTLFKVTAVSSALATNARIKAIGIAVS